MQNSILLLCDQVQGPARQARPTVNHTYNTAHETARSKQLLNLELQAIILRYSMPFVTLDVQEANKDCDDSEYATTLTHLAAALVRSPAVHDASALELCEQTLAFRRRGACLTASTRTEDKGFVTGHKV